MDAHIDGYKERTLFLSEAASVSTHQFGPGFGIRPYPPLIRPSVYQHVHNQRLRIWDIILVIYMRLSYKLETCTQSYKCVYIYIYTNTMYMYKSYIIYKLYYKCVKWLIPSLMAYLYYSYIAHHTLIVWSMAYTIIYHPKSL